MTSNTLPFEKSLAELDIIVKKLEQGELTLDESLKEYENAIHLARQCQKILTEAEQKVEKLSVIEDEDAP